MSAPVKMTTRGATGKRPVRKSYSSDEDELMPRVVLPIKPPQKKQAAKGTAADKVTGTVGFTSTSPKKRPLPQTPKEEDLAAVVPTPAGTTTDAPKRKKAKTAVTEKEVGRAEQAKPKTAKTAKSPTPETAPSAASATAAAPKKAKADAPKDAAATTSKKTSSKPDLVRERGTFSGIDAEANERGDDGDDGGTGVRRRGEDEEEDEDDGIPLGDDASGLDYFSRRKLASRTSDFTMSRLPHIEDKEIHEALRGFKDPIAASRQELVELHESNFSRWKTEVGLGCNLLFFGFGSKRTLLARFVTEQLGHLPIVVINGYFPNLSIKTVLCSITERVLGERVTFRNNLEHAEAIAKQFPARGKNKMIVLVHSIDGPSMRGSKVQTILSKLAAAPNIHVVASCDHINVGIMWDSVMTSRYSFVWHDLTTFAFYDAETSYETSLFGTRGKPTSRSVGQVLRSLTTNAKGIFTLLAQHQIAQEELAKSTNENSGGSSAAAAANEETSTLGLTFETLYQMCREEFFVSNDQTLRTHLVEFKDHDIIQTRRTNNIEYLFIPLAADVLRVVMENNAGDAGGAAVAAATAE